MTKIAIVGAGSAVFAQQMIPNVRAINSLNAGGSVLLPHSMIRDRERAVRAPMLDPLTAAACSLDEIRAMLGELMEAEQVALPAYLREAVVA